MSKARDKANSTVTNFASTGIDDNADANAITIDSSEKVGIGDTSPLGNKVHIRTAGSATSVNGDAGLVLESDDSTRCDLQFMGPDGAFQSIYFGDVSDDNRGIIAYSHSGNNMRFTVDASERMRLTADGLTFNGDTAAANALDDYEEGTFTPIFQQGLTSAGYSSQEGTYVKIGSLVVCSVFLRANSGTENGDHIYVGGLPFTVITGTGIDHQYGAFFTYNGGFWSSDANTQWLARANETNLAFYKQADGGAIQGSTSGVATNLNADLRLVAVYRST